MWEVAGKTVLITGSSAGIGFEAAVALARLGARILVVGRDRGRTDAAVVALRDRAGVTAEAHLCDFSSQASIREFARTIQRDHARLDVLINNAGGVHTRRSVTVDGIETTFATNHLGYFLLTTLLRDLIVRSAGLHRHCRVDRPSPRHADSTIRMVNGATAFARCMSARSQRCPRLSKPEHMTSSGSFRSVATISVGHRDEAAVAFSSPLRRRAGPRSCRWRKPGARDVTGRYFEGGRPVAPSRLAQDAALARRLWDVSARFTRSSD